MEPGFVLQFTELTTNYTIFLALFLHTSHKEWGFKDDIKLSKYDNPKVNVVFSLECSLFMNYQIIRQRKIQVYRMTVSSE